MTISPTEVVVTGVGQCSLDLLGLVDSYPAVDTKKEVLLWSEQGGGPVATALVALARLGVRTRFHGVIGDDEAGRKIRRSLVTEGVDVSGLTTRHDTASQLAFIAVENATARRTIFWQRPGGRDLRPEELGPHFLAGSGFLLLDGLMADVALFAARKARTLGVPSMLDAGRLRPGMTELARVCDFVVASEEFAADMGWDVTGEALQEERERLGIAFLTVTLGARGSVTACSEGSFLIRAFEVQTLDTTGAGDVFHGGLVYGILHRWPPRDCLAFASAAAALKCMKLGGRAGIPRLAEVVAFLREQGCDFSGPCRR